MMRMMMAVVMMMEANIHWACVKYLVLLRCLTQTVSLTLMMCLSTSTLVYTQWNLGFYLSMVTCLLKTQMKSSTFYYMRPYRLQVAWGKDWVLSLSAFPKHSAECHVLRRYSVISVWFHTPWRRRRVLKSFTLISFLCSLTSSFISSL